MNQELILYLSQFVTPERIELYHRVLDERTRYFTVVLEDIYHSQNASAVVRSCDCFGVQDLHTIENRNEFNMSERVARGSDNWVTHRQYKTLGKNNTLEALNQLKSDGYRIVATTPRPGAVSLSDFDVCKGKFALVFGTEFTGISEIVAQQADEFLTIPMVGFTESLNISVSAAIIINHMATKIRQAENINWKLNASEKEELLLEWIKQRIKKVDLLIEEFNKKKG
jgi:tRNA (guanosine-2'-O-)-methyltransferase